MFDKFSIVSLTLLFVVVLVQGQDQVQRGPPDFCIRDELISHFLDHYHKDAPSPEENNFPECTSWQNLSCCTHALADDLSRLATQQGLYNFTFAHCDSVSPECARYHKDGDCFYFCEPMLGYFQIPPTGSDIIANVPVCADYCDAWFEACKDDMTCVEYWWAEFEFEEGSNSNRCPNDSTCRTFKEVYGDGRGLCNKIWGNQIFYSTNRDNCTVMAFDNRMPNPNFKLTFPRSGSMSVVKLGSTMIHAGALLMPLVITAAFY